MTRMKHGARVLVGMFALMMSVGPMASAAESQANLHTGGVMVWLKEHRPVKQDGSDRQSAQIEKRERAAMEEAQIQTGGVMVWLKNWMEGHR